MKRPATCPTPTAPLPEPPDRASAPDIAEKYRVPLSSVYALMNDGSLPSWRIARFKRCTSWLAVRAFFGDRGTTELEA